MPMNMNDYPPDWPDIAARIKAEVHYICEDCGRQCRRPGERFDTHRRTMSVHHVGAPKPDGSEGDQHDKMDVRRENLLALCSKCHLARDLPIHMANAARTRRAKKIQAGQMEMTL